MKKIKILVITIAALFAVVYTLNLEYFARGIRIVYLNLETTVFIAVSYTHLTLPTKRIV